jgi:hypothetical protein
MASHIPHVATARPRLPTWPAVIEAACRFGHVARGFVYVSVGALALLTALHLAPKSRGVMAALEAWSAWPLGMVLLGLIGLGLYGFAGWRVMQSIFDADQQGTGAKAVTARLGQAISGAIYGGLAYSVFSLIDALGDLRHVDDEAKTRAAIASLLALPAGDLLVIAAGLFVAGCGVGNIVQALTRDFCQHLDCSHGMARTAALLGKVGYLARGIVFIPVGGFLALAGLHARSSEAKGTAAALDWLAARPFGDLLLAFTALGLIAFGAYGFVEARFRVMPGLSPSVGEPQ